MKRFAGLLAVCSLGLLGLTTLSAADKDPKDSTIAKETPPNYYPLKAGSKWTFRMDVDGTELGVMTFEAAKMENIDKKMLMLMESKLKGRLAATEHLTSTDQGIFRHRFNGAEVNPPVCLLRYPAKKGDAWETEAKIGEESVKLNCKVVDVAEEVTVPAGKYKAAHVDVEAETGGMKVTTTYWFAPKVGMVKQTIGIAGKTIKLELEKYEEGK